MALDTNLLLRKDGLKYTQIVLGGMEIDAIEESIKEVNAMEHSTNPHIGVNASDTEFITQYGRKLSFKSVVHEIESSNSGQGHRIQDYQNLFDIHKKTSAYLVSNSHASYNGKYIITKFDKEEEAGGSFVIDWELQEIITAPVTSKTFRVWGKAPSATTTPTTTTKKVTVSTNTKILITKCYLMSRKKHGTKTGLVCVKRLQTFLKANGFFLKYKTNGNFNKATEIELKKLQRKRKIPQSGAWDSKTRLFYKKLTKL